MSPTSIAAGGAADPITADPITADPITELFMDLAGMSPADMARETTLHDAGVDSLSAMELLLAVEHVIGREIALEALDALHTVGDLLVLLDDLRSEVSR